MKHAKKNPRSGRAPSSLAKKTASGAPNRPDSGEVALDDLGGDDTAPEFVDPEADLPEPSTEVEPTLVRLNKYLADHGIASRRKCDELIVGGQVTIDGNITTELGSRIDPTKHTVEIDGFILKPQGLRRRYYLLNKPSGVVCTNEPRETRPRAVDLITDARKGRIYTVGRLDEESKGLILLTNDGDFANRIMHPRYGVEKTYLVRVAGKIDDEALTKIREGVRLSEGRTAGARILVNQRLRDQSTLTLTLNEGMNREIRRSFAHVGYKVVELRRTRIGPLSDRGIKIGRWRELTREEVTALLAGRNESEEARDDTRGGAPSRGGARQRGAGPGAGSGAGHGRDRDHRGDGAGARVRRPAARRPKVRSGWRAFEERGGEKPSVGRANRGHPARTGRHAQSGGPERPGSTMRDVRGAGPSRDARGGRDRRDAPGRGERGGGRGSSAPRRGGGGPGAHARMQKSGRDRRSPTSGARGASPSGRVPFGKRSGKPAQRGANRRG